MQLSFELFHSLQEVVAFLVVFCEGGSHEGVIEVLRVYSGYHLAGELALVGQSLAGALLEDFVPLEVPCVEEKASEAILAPACRLEDALELL